MVQTVRLRQSAIEFARLLVRRDQIYSKLTSHRVYGFECLSLVVLLHTAVEIDVLPFETGKAVVLAASKDVECDVEDATFKGQSVLDMFIEDLQGDLGFQEGGKISVEMGDCSVPVTVAAVNVEYMRSSVERLERCQQAIDMMLNAEDDAAFDAACAQALALGGMDSMMTQCKLMHDQDTMSAKRVRSSDDDDLGLDFTFEPAVKRAHTE